MGVRGGYAAVVLCVVVATVGCRRGSLARDGGTNDGGGLGAIGGPASGSGGGGGSGAAAGSGAPGWGGFGGSAAGGAPVSAAESRAWTWTPCGTIPSDFSGTRSSPLVAAQFAPDDHALALTSSDGRVLIYTLPLDPLAAPRELRPAGVAAAVTFSPDWSLFAEGGRDRVSVRRAVDGSLVRELVETAASPCRGDSPRFSAAGDLVLYGACVWQVADGALRGYLPDVLDATFRGDRIVALGCAPRPTGGIEGVCSYDLAGNEISRRILAVEFGSLFTASNARIAPRGDVVFWPNGSRMYAYDTDSGALKWTVPGSLFTEVSQRPVFSPDGDLVLFTSTNPTAVTRIADGTPVLPAAREASTLPALAISAGGRLVVSSERSSAPDLYGLRETETGASLRLLTKNPQLGAVEALAISADGAELVSFSGGVVGWRVAPAFAGSAPIWRRGSPGATNVDISPDGRLAAISGDVRQLVSAVDGRVKFVRDATDANPLLRHFCVGTQARFSNDSRFVAARAYDGSIEIHDTTSFARVAAIPSTSCSGGIAFSRDGTLLATSQPAVFSVAGWSQRWMATPLPDHEISNVAYDNPRTDVEFSPDGQRLLITTCNSACVTSWWSGGVVLPGLAARRPRISAEGHWIVAGQTLLHEPSGDVRTLAIDATVGIHATVAIFAPNGDVIAGDFGGGLTRFCRGP